MTVFQFDPEKSFDENVAAFKEYCATIDPECAEILFDELDTLMGDGDANTARKRRSDFNAAAINALEANAAKHGKSS